MNNTEIRILKTLLKQHMDNLTLSYHRETPYFKVVSDLFNKLQPIRDREVDWWKYKQAPHIEF